VIRRETPAATGTSRPVELTPEQRAALVEAIGVWVDEAGDKGLPKGVAELRLVFRSHAGPDAGGH
jgi:hypothetical protein